MVKLWVLKKRNTRKAMAEGCGATFEKNSDKWMENEDTTEERKRRKNFTNESHACKLL